ncbi:hypothetical protein EV424DRAFT_1541839 [Suillus variegatus]|nr:hypothetical protein EV424DRAFT_1541839 [Suillus variegatus]
MSGSFSSSETSFATPGEYSTICPCGRSFAQLNAYVNHQRTCKKRKKHLSSALAKAKEMWTTRKRPCLDDRPSMMTRRIPPSIFHQDVATCTSHEPPGESGANTALDHEFASSKFRSEEATVGEAECNPGSVPGTENDSVRMGAVLQNLCMQLMIDGRSLSIAQDTFIVVCLHGFEIFFLNPHPRP